MGSDRLVVVHLFDQSVCDCGCGFLAGWIGEAPTRCGGVCHLQHDVEYKKERRSVVVDLVGLYFHSSVNIRGNLRREKGHCSFGNADSVSLGMQILPL